MSVNTVSEQFVLTFIWSQTCSRFGISINFNQLRVVADVQRELGASCISDERRRRANDQFSVCSFILQLRLRRLKCSKIRKFHMCIVPKHTQTLGTRGTEDEVSGDGGGAGAGTEQRHTRVWRCAKVITAPLYNCSAAVASKIRKYIFMP